MMAHAIRCGNGLAAILLLPLVLTAAPLRLVSPQDGATVPTLLDGQKAYVQMPRVERVPFFADAKKRAGMKELGYYPRPVRLAWEGGASDASYQVTVKRLPDGKVFFSRQVTNAWVDVDNLEIARTYAWSVTGGGELTAKFSTEDVAPRLIRIPGVPNVRDLGGRIGRNGRRVRQGRVFRSAGLNGNAHDVFYTKEEMRKNGMSAQMEREKALLARQAAQWKAWADDPKTVKVIHSPLGKNWTIRFADGKESPVEQDAHGNFRVETEPVGAVTLRQHFEAKQEGVFLAGVTKTQLATIRLDGNVVHDLAGLSGDHVKKLSRDDTTVAVFVTRGRHEISVTVDPKGSKRVWRLSHGSRSGIAKALAAMGRNVEMRRKSLGKVLKGREAGRNRLTDETRAYMLDELGIRSDIDLRSNGECYGMTGSPLGPTVTWFHYSSSAYGGMQGDKGKSAFKKVFAVFLDEKNYPIDFHCIAGQDRTGAVAFILNGLLGVAEDDLYLDWEVTGFWNGNASFCHEKRFDHLVAGFAKLPGATLHEKIENYVLSLGFTKADIEKFRSLMLE